MNHDVMSEAYKQYQPGGNFLNTPIWMSGGDRDPIATPNLVGLVQMSMRRTGFTRVRLERFAGSHQIKRSEVRLALQWFRQLGGF